MHEMEEPQTWQELLHTIISDPLEHQRIATTMGINPITLTRWTNKTSLPRPANLRALLNAIPRQRQKMQALLQKDIPNYLSESSLEEPLVQEIPSAFYSNIINIYTTSPPLLRSSTICITIFQQMLRHLDHLKQGLQILICQCVPPFAGEKIRSLRVTLIRATPPWESSIENQITLLGLESPVGNAVSRGHIIIVQSNKELTQHYPTYQISFAESLVAFPLLNFDQTAGAIVVISTQPDYFSAAHIELIQGYTDLLILAFGPDQFYPLKEINLGILPPSDIQEQYLENFQAEVTRTMLAAEKNHQQMKRADAELAVWKKLEELFLGINPFKNDE